MPNYYELLNVKPTATTPEIQVALDDKYNQYRRLVTHHDPTMVNQATQALQTIEQIREVLMSPERKAVYDETLGLSGTVVGGLSDPQSTSAQPSIGMPAMVPPLAHAAQATYASTPSAPLEGWLCTKCNSISQVGSLYCKSCGGEIGQTCPKCGKLYEKTAKFCPACGVNPQKFSEEQEQARVQAQEQQRQGIRQKLSEAEAHLQNGKFGLAKDALGSFEGLGNSKGQILCRKNEPEWRKAQVLDQNANTTRKAFIKQNTLKIMVGYAAAGMSLGIIIGISSLIGHISNVIKYQYTFQWSYLFQPFLIALGLAVGGAIAAAAGSGIYFYRFGGRRSINQDLLIGAACPILLAVTMALGAWCFVGILAFIAVGFGLMTFVSANNRKS